MITEQRVCVVEHNQSSVFYSPLEEIRSSGHRLVALSDDFIPPDGLPPNVVLDLDGLGLPVSDVGAPANGLHLVPVALVVTQMAGLLEQRNSSAQAKQRSWRNEKEKRNADSLWGKKRSGTNECKRTRDYSAFSRER